MSENHIAQAEAYYTTMRNKDIAGVERYLHPNAEFIGPLAVMKGKKDVLEAAKKFLAFFNRLTKLYGQSSVMMIK